MLSAENLLTKPILICEGHLGWMMNVYYMLVLKVRGIGEHGQSRAGLY